MDFEAKGMKVTVDAVVQSNELLLSAAKEIADEARARGLELPFGIVAVQSTVERPTTSGAERLVAEQEAQSFKAYESIVDLINQSKNKKDRIVPAETHQFESELYEWLGEDEDKLAYVSQAMEADPELSFTLVATPNVVLTPKQFKDVAKKFGENQPYPTYIWNELYDKYTPAQLCSGTSYASSFLFSLIPSKLNEGMYGTVSEQRAKLEKLQRSQETAFLKVPSPLEAVAYWNTLRAQGDRLEGTDNFDKTYIRHFDLSEQRFDGNLFVPFSCVRGNGEPNLLRSLARDGSDARVAVG